jgi:uncharacterized delta-60 repeat protein
MQSTRTNRLSRLPHLFAVSIAAVLAAGRCTAAPADLDPSFGSGEFVAQVGSFPDSGTVVTLQSNGDVLAGGNTQAAASGGYTNWAFARRTSSGATDASFGAGSGSVEFGRGGLYNGLGPEGQVEDLVVQQNGRILGVGNGYDTATGTHYNTFLTRLMANGSVDTTFGSGGQVETAFGTDREVGNMAYSVALQQNGMAVVSGAAFDSGQGVFKPIVARYTTVGKLDNSFGQAGIFSYPASVSSAYWGPGQMVNLLPDGRIVIGTTGELMGHPVVVQLTANGQLDPSFGSNGIVTVEAINGNLVALIVLPDGKMIGTEGQHVFRLNADGSLDTSFNSPYGLLPVNIGISALAPLPTGQILVTGTVAPSSDFAVARITAVGALDATFKNTPGVNGIVPTPGPGGSSSVEPTSIAVQPNGHFVIGGSDAGEFPARQFLFARFDGTPLLLLPKTAVFTNVTGVPVATVQVSDVITIAGLTNAAVVPISVAGGSYSVNGEAFTTLLGYVSNGDQVMVEHTSAATPATTVTTTLHIGGINARNSPWLVRGAQRVATFTSTTQ